jgi:16S rRNA (guanine966-N2)-methyltransferase
VKKTGTGCVRIIAGQLKGSKLPVLDKQGLRPTSSRVRETVFNWLQHNIQGKRVLDLFAGSGALGFEAASRLAKQVVLVEHDAATVQQLHENKARLNVDSAEIIQADSLKWLAAHHGPSFDIIFLDPPYAFEQWQVLWQSLAPMCAEQSLVYVEHSVQQSIDWPKQLTLLKQGKTVQSQFFLAQWHKSPVG